MPASVALGFVSVAFFLGALKSYLKERRARRWPATSARVVETAPQSLLERSGRMFVFNRDSDHFLEWSVNGQSYRVKLPDDAHIAISGFKLWRRAPSADARVLHYDPAWPMKHVLAEDFGAWKALLTVAVAAGIGAFLFSAN